MSSLEAKKIAPATATTVTLGAAGDTVNVSATSLKTNTIKDAGGNTLLTSNGSGILSSINGALKGGLAFISSQTASGEASISFTSGIDSTYNEYIFHLVNIQPATNDVEFYFNVSIDGGSNYNVAKTSTAFYSFQTEDNSGSGLAYWPAGTLANGTGDQIMYEGMGSDADECGSAILHLYSPTSTTYAKQFKYTTIHGNAASPTYCIRVMGGGYVNTASAVNAIIFRMGSGNMDGTIAMYGTG